MAATPGAAAPREFRLAGRPMQRIAIADTTLGLLEVPWADTAPRAPGTRAVASLVAAPGLVAFWLGGLARRAAISRLRAGATAARSLVAGLGGGALLLVLWVLLVAWLALAELRALGSVGERGGLALVVALLVGLGLRDAMAEITGLGAYVRDYLRAPPDGRLRALPRLRLLDAIALGAEEKYERILVVAHSHGTVIAPDAAAGALPAPVHLVSLGSPLIALRAWAEWLDPALERAFANPAVTGWTDLHAATDWLCGPVPGQAARYGDSIALTFDAPWIERATLRTHARYLDETSVARRIVAVARPG